MSNLSISYPSLMIFIIIPPATKLGVYIGFTQSICLSVYVHSVASSSAYILLIFGTNIV